MRMGLAEPHSLPVIASEAKQSIARHNGWMDCFAGARNDGDRALHSRFAHCAIQWQNYSQIKPRQPVKAAREEFHAVFGSHARHCRTIRRARRAMLLRMRAESRRNHPFLIWAPFEAPARSWSYGEFHERVGAL